MTNINRLKAVLAEKGKSAKWLAESLGKDPATISKWCTNRNQPTIETFINVARILEVDVRELFVSTKPHK